MEKIVWMRRETEGHAAAKTRDASGNVCTYRLGKMGWYTEDAVMPDQRLSDALHRRYDTMGAWDMDSWGEVEPVEVGDLLPRDGVIDLSGDLLPRAGGVDLPGGLVLPPGRPLPELLEDYFQDVFGEEVERVKLVKLVGDRGLQFRCVRPIRCPPEWAGKVKAL